jgi:hypothetical protein
MAKNILHYLIRLGLFSFFEMQAENANNENILHYLG